MIWIILSVLALASAGFLAFGTRQESEILGREDGAVAILTDQLGEIATDRDRGLITTEEATAAEVEIKRRLLVVSRSQGKAAAKGSGRWAIAAASILVPLAAGALYLKVGAPDVESMAFAERAVEQEEAAEIVDLTARLRARLQSDESGGPTEGWVLLGQTYMRMGRYSDAVDAYARLEGRADADSSILSRYAEALIANDNGIVTPQAERVIDTAMELDPQNPAAVFYKAQALEQGGALSASRALLLGHLEAADGFYPWMEVFVASVNRLGQQTGVAPISLADFAPMLDGGRGPSAADVAAAEEMSQGDRDAFIRSMVEGLAARLEEEPSDIEGWMRLIRAYTVLGEDEAASTARERALAVAEALPKDDPRRAAVLTQLNAATD